MSDSSSHSEDVKVSVEARPGAIPARPRGTTSRPMKFDDYHSFDRPDARERNAVSFAGLTLGPRDKQPIPAWVPGKATRFLRLSVGASVPFEGADVFDAIQRVLAQSEDLPETTIMQGVRLKLQYLAPSGDEILLGGSPADCQWAGNRSLGGILVDVDSSQT
ncbi:MAG: uncharacterized protein KVP18_001799 [Porospora cf. gigantea A]|uniref:uncharacterized protein n=2 Tax=Porospora cf. gigantea A TaxID=2853593 RepID=UPI0035597B4D|nr:MAG: hypothetical protein KVP18_001799 [Porospora cf. gigantea A]